MSSPATPPRPAARPPPATPPLVGGSLDPGRPAPDRRLARSRPPRPPPAVPPRPAAHPPPAVPPPTGGSPEPGRAVAFLCTRSTYRDGSWQISGHAVAAESSGK
ncbi:cyclin-K-like isoform X2 [Sorghum bicolor]|uniref:cyclin-K-like isoform X2 n=1 Tax=Sorghum bicolor TaxID=4558 RepID=UPI000B4241A8|nr:cyclin-K-like isoform X2 [Sorghum bicolor]|eukprot:XP_021315968.1 cyclin-K-like isoform X2 [Sorghum bicolor]